MVFTRAFKGVVQAATTRQPCVFAWPSARSSTASAYLRGFPRRYRFTRASPCSEKETNYCESSCKARGGIPGFQHASVMRMRSCLHRRPHTAKMKHLFPGKAVELARNGPRAYQRPFGSASSACSCICGGPHTETRF